MSRVITVVAPINIAVIKYWGKRDEELIIPLNDSVSATLDTKVMRAKTTACVSPNFENDEIWLNGRRESFNNPRLQSCLREIKSRAIAEGSVNDVFLSWKIHVCSENNFPTAAGLASSAAGYACLVTALAKLYRVKSDVSSIARLGSGSACRSIYGGFVHWHAGVKADGSDSIATQIVDNFHWPEMRVIIMVVADKSKKISSTEGMKISKETSELLQYRVDKCVSKRTEEMCEAIINRNFHKFAEITMKDSNQFHAVCLDSYPPVSYLTEISLKIIDFVHKYNTISKESKVAYTFDAGPNACLYLLEPEVPKVLGIIQNLFPSTYPNIFFKGMPSEVEPVNAELLKALSLQPEKNDSLKYVIHTKIGEGPKEITGGKALLNDNGWPVNLIVEEIIEPRFLF